jgi:hypothetical protein
LRVIKSAACQAGGAVDDEDEAADREADDEDHPAVRVQPGVEQGEPPASTANPAAWANTVMLR